MENLFDFPFPSCEVPLTPPTRYTSDFMLSEGALTCDPAALLSSSTSSKQSTSGGSDDKHDTTNPHSLNAGMALNDAAFSLNNVDTGNPWSMMMSASAQMSSFTPSSLDNMSYPSANAFPFPSSMTSTPWFVDPQNMMTMANPAAAALVANYTTTSPFPHPHLAAFSPATTPEPFIHHHHPTTTTAASRPSTSCSSSSSAAAATAALITSTAPPAPPLTSTPKDTQHSVSLSPSPARGRTPRRASPALRQLGPTLLPKIRSQDQAIIDAVDAHQHHQRHQPVQSSSTGLGASSLLTAMPKPSVIRAGTCSPKHRIRKAAAAGAMAATAAGSMVLHGRGGGRAHHARSFTNPEMLSWVVQQQSSTPPLQMTPGMSMSPEPELYSRASSLAPGPGPSPAPAPTSSMYHAPLDFFTFPSSYGSILPSTEDVYPTTTTTTTVQPETTNAATVDESLPSTAPTNQEDLAMPQSLLFSLDVGSRAEPTTSLQAYLTSPNPTPSLVQTVVGYTPRSIHTRHFWWDVRQIRAWKDFSMDSLRQLIPGFDAMLTAPVPQSLAPAPNDDFLRDPKAKFPETEAALYSLYASYYLPKVNTALSLSSSPDQAPLHFTMTNPAPAGQPDDLFLFATASMSMEKSTSGGFFYAHPAPRQARIIGLVRSFDRFNTGMRVENNIKRVEYLKTLSALHQVMRDHGCRYGFIMTEIELVVVRNGDERVPHFGFLELATIPLATANDSATAPDDATGSIDAPPTPLTACLALWALATLASAADPSTTTPWYTAIGQPQEGTRHKALPRDAWMPTIQMMEKREARRLRGWVFPEDPLTRKEVGKRIIHSLPVKKRTSSLSF